MGDMEPDILNDPLVAKRLMDKCEPDANGCLVFGGASSGSGYGMIWDGGRPTGAHRVSYRLHKGPIPSGYAVCHTCDNKKCVLPEHLFAAPQLVNMADMRAKGRGAQGPTLAAAISKGWTAAHRAKKAEQTRAANALRREARRAAAGVPDDHYQCRDCLEWAPLETFPTRGNGDPYSYCRPCYRVRAREATRRYRARRAGRTTD